MHCGQTKSVRILTILTHRGRDQMKETSQTTFSNAFSRMKMKIPEFWLKFHWKFYPIVQSTIFQHWFRNWLGAGQATNHYLDQWYPSLTYAYMRHLASMRRHEKTRAGIPYTNHFSSLVLSAFSIIETFILNVTFIFDRCHHSWDYNSTDITRSFTKANTSWKSFLILIQISKVFVVYFQEFCCQ